MSAPAAALRLPPVPYVRRPRRSRRVASVRVGAAPGPDWLGRAPRPLLWAALLLASGGVHAAVIARADVRAHDAARRVERMRVVVVEKPAPVVEPPKPVEPPPVAKLARVEKPRRVERPEPVPEPPTPPPPREEAPPAKQPPVLMPGISLSSTSTGGSFAVPTGNTLAGRPGSGRPGEAAGHGKDPHGAVGVAPGYALTEAPVFLDNVSADEVRRHYPEAARKAKIEGVVRVLLTVDADGKVARPRLVSDPGNGFGAAALALARLYRFKPAKIEGRPVATEIPFTIRFVLD